MQRIPVITKDGSSTISIPEMQVTYHSVYGAIQESQYVFIQKKRFTGFGPAEL